MIKFKINNHTWTIEHKPMEEMVEKYRRISPDACDCFGLTFRQFNKIYINENLCEEERIKTLKHELEKDNWLEKRMDLYFSKIEASIKNNSNNLYDEEVFKKAKDAFKDIFNSRIRSVKKQLEENIHNKQINYEPQINSSLIGGL